jgi:hypothetical protein
LEGTVPIILAAGARGLLGRLLVTIGTELSAGGALFVRRLNVLGLSIHSSVLLHAPQVTIE